MKTNTTTTIRYLVLIPVLLVTLLLQGCLVPLTSVRKEAFDGTKTYALVSVSAYNKIEARDRGESLAGLVKAASAKSGYSEDATHIFNSTYPLVLKELETVHGFHLVTGKKVLRSKAYRNFEGDKPEILWVNLLLPEGYKYFKSTEKLAQLATALNVDGVIIVSADYSFGTGGVNLGGLVKVGKQRAISTLTISAVDRKGEVVWHDAAESPSTEGLAVVGESGNFEALYPLFDDAVAKSIHTIVARLDERLQ